MTNPSDFLINKFAYTMSLNMIMLALFLPRIKLDEWFRKYCRKKDGSVLGLFIMAYGFLCVAGFVSFYWLFDFKAYDPLGVIKAAVPMGIITSIIPIMVGRELRHGRKLLTR